MQVSYPNEVRIYNLSAGKSLPEWLSDRKRRKLQQTDVDVQRRIELIQDFDMPDVSTTVSVSRDGQYILATGTYKPRLRCYDVKDLSMKFERCLDSDAIKMITLTEGYEKLLFLEDDRWIELHSQNGHYFRTRIPKFGRDMTYMPSSCDVYVVGASSYVYRLNLEQGRFLVPIRTNAREINSCDLNPVHYLMAFGTNEGYIEAWDPRSKDCAGTRDCNLPGLNSAVSRSTPELGVSKVVFKDALTMAVGLKSGQILLYDIRGKTPLLVKDHYYSLPIKTISFCNDFVFSMDSRCLKIWHENSGAPYTSIEPGVALNDHFLVPDTGLMFMANEGQKILSFYVPSLGPAPKWCSFLDNITEELEESGEASVYDDYKFLTVSELGGLGLDHLIGTSVLRAYMHGYFVDMRLYQKALLLADPFAYEKFKKKKVDEKLQEERKSRIAKEAKEKRDPVQEQLRMDPRWSAMFDDPDFEVDETSEDFMLRKPVQAKAAAKAARKLGKVQDTLQETSPPTEEIRKPMREKKKKLTPKADTPKSREEKQARTVKVYELESGEQFKGLASEILMPEIAREKEKNRHKSIAERLQTTTLESDDSASNKKSSLKKRRVKQ